MISQLAFISSLVPVVIGIAINSVEERDSRIMPRFKLFYKAVSLLAWYAGVAVLLVLFLLAYWVYRVFQNNQYQKPYQSVT